MDIPDQSSYSVIFLLPSCVVSNANRAIITSYSQHARYTLLVQE